MTRLRPKHVGSQPSAQTRHVGSQPSAQPPLECAYRIMRPDLADLKWDPGLEKEQGYYWLPGLTKDSTFLRTTVLRAIGHGSYERSPFLHACADL